MVLQHHSSEDLSTTVTHLEMDAEASLLGLPLGRALVQRVDVLGEPQRRLLHVALLRDRPV